MLDALAELAGHLLWRASQRVTTTLGGALPAGVELNTHSILLALVENGPSSQQALAEATAVSRTTASRVAVDLAGRGLVERARSPGDRRSYTLTATTAGRAALAAWDVEVQSVERRVCAALGNDDREELLALLLRAVGPCLAPTTPVTLRASLSFLVTRLHERLHRAFSEALAPIGIEPRHFGSLVALAATGPVAQSELATILDVSDARVVGLVDDLEARDLVERRAAPGDRRTRLLRLRPVTRQVLERARGVEVTVTDELLEPLTTTERERLAHLLRRLLS